MGLRVHWLATVGQRQAAHAERRQCLAGGDELVAAPLGHRGKKGHRVVAIAAKQECAIARLALLGQFETAVAGGDHCCGRAVIAQQRI